MQSSRFSKMNRTLPSASAGYDMFLASKRRHAGTNRTPTAAGPRRTSTCPFCLYRSATPWVSMPLRFLKRMMKLSSLMHSSTIDLPFVCDSVKIWLHILPMPLQLAILDATRLAVDISSRVSILHPKGLPPCVFHRGASA